MQTSLSNIKHIIIYFVVLNYVINFQYIVCRKIVNINKVNLIHREKVFFFLENILIYECNCVIWSWISVRICKHKFRFHFVIGWNLISRFICSIWKGSRNLFSIEIWDDEEKSGFSNYILPTKALSNKNLVRSIKESNISRIFQK